MDDIDATATPEATQAPGSSREGIRRTLVAFERTALGASATCVAITITCLQLQPLSTPLTAAVWLSAAAIPPAVGAAALIHLVVAETHRDTYVPSPERALVVFVILATIATLAALMCVFWYLSKPASGIFGLGLGAAIVLTNVRQVTWRTHKRQQAERSAGAARKP